MRRVITWGKVKCTGIHCVLCGEEIPINTNTFEACDWPNEEERRAICKRVAAMDMETFMKEPGPFHVDICLSCVNKIYNIVRREKERDERRWYYWLGETLIEGE